MNQWREISAQSPRPKGSAARAERRSIGRQLAVAFGVVASISIAMCLVECMLVFRAGRLVAGMQEMEAEFGSGARLATAVREQYIHQVHWIIDRDPEHLEHAREAAARIGEETRILLQNSDPKSRLDLGELKRGSAALARVFLDEVVPAVESGDEALVRRLHQTMDRVSSGINAEADKVATDKIRAMADSHDRAMRTTRLGIWIAVACISSVLLVSSYFVLRLRRAVAMPLKALAEAAMAFGRGELGVRVAEPAQVELRALARAFNRMALELTARQDRLIHSERMAAIGQLATGLAHEINNPIGIIRGYLRTMTPESPSKQLAEELRILDEEAAACQRLARDLLDLSRTSSLQPSPTDMNRLLSEAVRRFRETPEAKRRVIEVDAKPGASVVDEGRVRQVVLNLVANAVEMSPEASVVTVAGEPTHDGGYVFTVADRGPGIAPADRERVYEPFYSTSSRGSGLGLTVCREIVRAHGGSIELRERDGGGTLAEVVLPMAPDAEG